MPLSNLHPANNSLPLFDSSGRTETDNSTEEERVRIETRRGISILADGAAHRYAEIAAYDPDNEHSTDVDHGSDTPHFDRFYEEGGAEGLKKLTYFDPIQYQDV